MMIVYWKSTQQLKLVHLAPRKSTTCNMISLCFSSAVRATCVLIRHLLYSLSLSLSLFGIKKWTNHKTHIKFTVLVLRQSRCRFSRPAYRRRRVCRWSWWFLRLSPSVSLWWSRNCMWRSVGQLRLWGWGTTSSGGPRSQAVSQNKIWVIKSLIAAKYELLLWWNSSLKVTKELKLYSTPFKKK